MDRIIAFFGELLLGRNRNLKRAATICVGRLLE
jgi:hypothetical protein